MLFRPDVFLLLHGHAKIRQRAQWVGGQNIQGQTEREAEENSQNDRRKYQKNNHLQQNDKQQNQPTTHLYKYTKQNQNKHVHLKILTTTLNKKFIISLFNLQHKKLLHHHLNSHTSNTT